MIVSKAACPVLSLSERCRGGRKPTHLTSGNIRIRQLQKPSAWNHEAKKMDVSRKNTDVSRVVFPPSAVDLLVLTILDQMLYIIYLLQNKLP
jgi:hypothetical protein